ncbi:MAG: glycosyltransferase family 2 protein [Planctomycetota bacterium]|jgi:glycosyltransferase involved in cell wall biosynthesis
MSEAPQKEAEERHLVVIMPALNEEATVGETIRRIPQEIPGVASIDVMVVDDGSTDGTVREARSAGAIVLSHPAHRGLGAAFQSGLSRSLEMGADLIVSIDSDGQFDPQTITELIAPVVSGDADFATASRFADPALTPDMSRIKLWGNRMMSRLISSRR